MFVLIHNLSTYQNSYGRIFLTRELDNTSFSKKLQVKIAQKQIQHLGPFYEPRVIHKTILQ